MSYVVIGSNYGDEGKGLMTDYLVRKTGAKTVVRFNGGAQAGHTVVDPSGKRHVFGHIGAGTFAKADTYLSATFIVNTLVLSKELKQLGEQATIFADSYCRCTTIFDMMINAEIERSRGEGRHGSCGLGIHETVLRSSTYPIRFGDLKTGSVNFVADKLATIAKYYVPMRLAELGLVASGHLRELLSTTDFTAHAQQMMYGATEIQVPRYAPARYGHVFEGAQGLALDEELGHFPHVTHSRTGLPDAVVTAGQIGVSSLFPVYVTRAYVTRHGRGPLAGEGLPIVKTKTHPVDATNVRNEFQEAIRFAPLDVTAMNRLIKSDLRRVSESNMIGVHIERPVIALTCMDQMDEEVSVMVGDRHEWMPASSLPRFIERATGYKVRFISTGPSSGDVQDMGSVI